MLVTIEGGNFMPNLRGSATFLCRLRSFQTPAGMILCILVGSSIMPAFKVSWKKKKRGKGKGTGKRRKSDEGWLTHCYGSFQLCVMLLPSPSKQTRVRTISSVPECSAAPILTTTSISAPISIRPMAPVLIGRAPMPETHHHHPPLKKE